MQGMEVVKVMLGVMVHVSDGAWLRVIFEMVGVDGEWKWDVL